MSLMDILAGHRRDEILNAANERAQREALNNEPFWKRYGLPQENYTQQAFEQDWKRRTIRSLWYMPFQWKYVPDNPPADPKLLLNPSDATLNRIFACEFTDARYEATVPEDGQQRYKDVDNCWVPVQLAPKYCSHFELVQPFLEVPSMQRVEIERREDKLWQVGVCRYGRNDPFYYGCSAELARAAVIALLQSKGYTIHSNIQ